MDASLDLRRECSWFSIQFFIIFLCFLCILRIKIGYKKKKTPFLCRIIIKNICKSINILYILFINIVYFVNSIHFLSVLSQKKKEKYDMTSSIYDIIIILRQNLSCGLCICPSPHTHAPCGQGLFDSWICIIISIYSYICIFWIGK